MKPDWYKLGNDQEKVVSLQENLKRHVNVVYTNKEVNSQRISYPLAQVGTEPAFKPSQIILWNPRFSIISQEGMLIKPMAGLILCLLSCFPLHFFCSSSYILLLSIYWRLFVVVIRQFWNTAFYCNYFTSLICPTRI